MRDSHDLLVVRPERASGINGPTFVTGTAEAAVDNSTKAEDSARGSNPEARGPVGKNIVDTRALTTVKCSSNRPQRFHILIVFSPQPYEHTDTHQTLPPHTELLRRGPLPAATMKASWCSCVLGLLSVAAFQRTFRANAITVTQTPSSLVASLKSSAMITCSITCSITTKDVLGVTLSHRFAEENIAYVALSDGKVLRVINATKFEGRVGPKLEILDGTSLRVNFTLSQLRVEDTNLYFCHWVYDIDKKIASNGTIFIVNDRLPKGTECGDVFEVYDVALFSLCIGSIPVLLFCLLLLVYVLHKRFRRNFKPSRLVSPPPRRPPPHRPLPPRPPSICSSTRNEHYHYLSTSVTLSFNQV
ncbi:hypothetical protein WMY93_010214 [Mugilogobius chulae]|uniref:Immunoglobulin V-set domain-containing protein n=1 Tax=Mugilogobius chulae TaxID=88201 RepID=A0AAW0P6V0_9GOBI